MPWALFSSSGPLSSPLAGGKQRRRILFALGLVGLLAGAGLFWDWYSTVPEAVQAAYVGRQTCLECHASQTHKWEGSDHDLAMAVATPHTVLGDFSGVEFTAHGVTSKMFRAGEKFMVRTEGLDGQLHDFEVKYTFGVRPLQQYLVEFDRPANMPEHEIARCQVLALSWDVAGRRWFHLDPPDVREKIQPGDDLHWTGVAFCWNTMCAECHSTNLEKKFDVATRTYHTTFSEINVSCEACHGPGSLHVDLARANSLFWDRTRGYGLAALKSKDSHVEVETCATCHARRRTVHPGFKPGHKFHDYYAHELLQENTYYPDGQILDEVYEYGSFIQSKMYHQGIRCTDCHDPHTTKLKFEGNKLCTSCHQHPAYKYDVPAHHQHQPEGAGAQCVDCHMPGKHYMEVDFRRDHSLRVPRPDLSVALHTPNACTGCHWQTDKEGAEKRAPWPRYADALAAARGGEPAAVAELNRLNGWAAAKVEEWYGRHHTPENHFAPALAAAWRGDVAGEEPLYRWLAQKDVSGMARASLLAQTGQYGGSNAELITGLLQHEDPTLRATAIRGLNFLTPRDQRRQFVPLLDDPIRLVRMEAAQALAGIPPADLSGTERDQLRAALFGEFVNGTLANNERAGAHVALGLLYEQFGDVAQAEKAYRAGLFVEPTAVSARTNLAMLLEARAARIEESLDATAPRVTPAVAGDLAQNARELRGEAQKLRIEELALIARDARLAPQLWAVQYDYGRALNGANQPEQAEKVLLRAVELNPNALPPVVELVLVNRKLKRWNEARRWAEKLLALRPQSTMFRELIDEIEMLRRDDAPPPP